MDVGRLEVAGGPLKFSAPLADSSNRSDDSSPWNQKSVAAIRSTACTHGSGYTPIATTPMAQMVMAALSTPGTGNGPGRVGASMYILRATSR